MSDKPESLLHQVKCDHCHQWTDGHKAFCSHCGEMLTEIQLEYERQKRTEDADLRHLLININPDDPIIIRFFKRIIRTVQIIFFALLSFMMWLIAMTPG